MFYIGFLSFDLHETRSKFLSAREGLLPLRNGWNILPFLFLMRSYSLILLTTKSEYLLLIFCAEEWWLCVLETFNNFYRTSTIL